MTHVNHKIWAIMISIVKVKTSTLANDISNSLEVNLSRICRSPGKDQLRFMETNHLLKIFIINIALLIETIMINIIGLAREANR